LAKAKKGGFKDTSLEYMVFALLQEVRKRSNLDPALVEDICLGNVSVRIPLLGTTSELVSDGQILI
jgi:acetyl-CoA acetyltransferase